MQKVALVSIHTIKFEYIYIYYIYISSVIVGDFKPSAQKYQLVKLEIFLQVGLRARTVWNRNLLLRF